MRGAEPLLGLQKTSVVDWPPYLASVIFFPGCNLRCPWCHNPDLVEGSGVGLVSWPEIRDHLVRRLGRIQAVVASGGEALLHPWLVPVLREVKALGYPLRLDTNGTRPDLLDSLPEGLVDTVAMDLKLDREGRFLDGQADSLAVLRRRWPKATLRLTWVPGWHKADMMEAIASFLGPATPLQLQGFVPGRTLDPAWAVKPPCREAELEGVRTGLAAALRGGLRP